MTTPMRLVIVLIALSLTGCTPLRWPEPIAAPDSGGLEVRLAEYYAYAGELEDKPWRDEVRRRKSSLKKGNCDASRLRLGMLLAHAPDREAFEPGAEVLAPCLDADGEPQRWPTLVHVLQADLQRRGDQLAQLEELGTALERVRERNRELARQVEALKAIERSIRERDNAASQPDGDLK